MNWQEYITPELLILIPVLVFIGAGLKKSPVRDELIPVLLGALGVSLALVWVLATCELHGTKSVFAAIFTAVTQGVLCAGASVYAHQIYKQLGAKNEQKGE